MLFGRFRARSLTVAAAVAGPSDTLCLSLLRTLDACVFVSLTLLPLPSPSLVRCAHVRLARSTVEPLTLLLHRLSRSLPPDETRASPLPSPALASAHVRVAPSLSAACIPSFSVAIVPSRSFRAFAPPRASSFVRHTCSPPTPARPRSPPLVPSSFLFFLPFATRSCHPRSFPLFFVFLPCGSVLVSPAAKDRARRGTTGLIDRRQSMVNRGTRVPTID